MSTLENVNKPIKEPLTVIPGPVNRSTRKVAGDESGRTADYDAWRQDLDERKARAVAMEEKRREHLKPVEPKVEFSAIDSVLSELDAAADDFEQTHLKPNLPLIEARNKVEPPVLPGLRYRPGSCSHTRILWREPECPDTG
jgi:hypothetical protein